MPLKSGGASYARAQEHPAGGCVSDENIVIYRLCGEVPKWPKGADCKSVGRRLRWFESSPLHQEITSRGGAVR
jgi:hypothetical protein